MEYFVLVVIFLSAFYAFSFAKSNWKEKNKFGAVGVILIALTSLVLPIIVLLLRP